MLKSELALGLAVAVATGCVIAIQTAFLSRSDASLGALRSGLLTTITGAVLASAVLLILWRMGSGSWQWNSSIWVALILGRHPGHRRAGWDFLCFATCRDYGGLGQHPPGTNAGLGVHRRGWLRQHGRHPILF